MNTPEFAIPTETQRFNYAPQTEEDHIATERAVASAGQYEQGQARKHQVRADAYSTIIRCPDDIAATLDAADTLVREPGPAKKVALPNLLDNDAIEVAILQHINHRESLAHKADRLKHWTQKMHENQNAPGLYTLLMFATTGRQIVKDVPVPDKPKIIANLENRLEEELDALPSPRVEHDMILLEDLDVPDRQIDLRMVFRNKEFMKSASQSDKPIVLQDLVDAMNKVKQSDADSYREKLQVKQDILIAFETGVLTDLLTEKLSKKGYESEEQKSRADESSAQPEVDSNLYEFVALSNLELLGVRTFTKLKQCGIVTVGDLRHKTKADLEAIPHLDQAGIDNAVEALAEIGLSLRDEDEEHDPAIME